MALSKDIRERVVSARKAKEGSVRALAKRFAIGVASATRLFRLERETGSVEPRPHGGGAQPKIPDSELPDFIALVEEKPDRTGEELRIEWERRKGVSVSRSVIVRALKRSKLTLKKNVSGERTRFRKKQRKAPDL